MIQVHFQLIDTSTDKHYNFQTIHSLIILSFHITNLLFDNDRLHKIAPFLYHSHIPILSVANDFCDTHPFCMKCKMHRSKVLPVYHNTNSHIKKVLYCYTQLLYTYLFPEVLIFYED